MQTKVASFFKALSGTLSIRTRRKKSRYVSNRPLSTVQMLEDRQLLTTLASWDFTGENQLATSTAEVIDTGLDVGGSLTRGAGAAASAGANSFRTVGFQNNGISVNNTDFFQTTLSADPGSNLSLSFIDARFAGTAGFAVSPGVSHQFAYSLDGTNFTLIGSPSVTVGTPASILGLNVSGVAALQNIPDTTTLTLRYYASGQTGTGGWGFNSPASGTVGLLIDGTVAPASDVIAPALISINDNDPNDTIIAGETLSYTVTFSEDILDGSVTAADFDNAVTSGPAGITIGTITETSAGVFSVQVTANTAGTLQLRIPTGALIEDVAGNDLVVPALDDTVVTVTAGDTTAPTVIINDNDADNVVAVGATVTYTLEFSEPITAAPAVSAFVGGGTATVNITNVQGSGTTYTVDVTPSTAGTILLTLLAGSVQDAANNALAADAVDTDTLTVDATAPTLVSITDNVSGGPIGEGATVIYTVSFNEDIDGATVTAADFSNAGSAPIAVGPITETGPGIFSVAVTATAPGTLTLQIPGSAVISDVVGNNLVVPLNDDTVITVNAVTALQAGDLAFAAFQADNTGGGFNGDAFQFVLLAPVLAGTTVFFTDSGYRTDSSAFRTNETMIRWVAQADLAAGTIVEFLAAGGTAPTSTAEWTGINPQTGATLTTGSLVLGTGGDNITALRAPVFGGLDALTGIAIAQITFGGATFAPTWIASSGNGSTALAPGLTDGLNAVSLAATDNGRYDETAVGSVEVGTKLAVGTSLNTDTFWVTSTTPLTPAGHTQGTFVIGADTTPPTITSIDNGDGDNAALVNETLTYTITFSEDIDAGTVSSADFNNAGTSDITIGTITETSPGVFSVQVTPTTAGSLIFRTPIPGATISDVAGNALAVAAQDAETVTVSASDTTPPTVVTIADNDANNSVLVNMAVLYTITFSEAIDAATVGVGDFTNAGTSTITVGTITEVSPTVFTVVITPTTAGTLILSVGGVADLAGNGLVGTTSDDDTLSAITVPTVWINELQYDNAGTDTGEFVEVAGPAGTDLSSFTIVLYNGLNGDTYASTTPASTTLSGQIDNEDGTGFGAVSFLIPGMQNGAPDGLALVFDGTIVLEFISYEGAFAATNGPANGLTSIDIGVSQSGSDAIGLTLQRNNAVPGTPGAWGGPFDDSPGTLNVFPAPSFAVASTDAAKAEGNTGTTAFTFTVSRGGDTSGANDVTFTVSGGAVNGADAADFSGAALPTGTVSFAAGETTKVVTIDVAGDAVFEPDESFVLTLSNPTAGAVITTATADGTIQNDDTAPNRAPVAIDDSLTSIAEDSGDRTILFTDLTLNDTDADGNALTVTAVGTAIGGTVTITGSTVVFSPTLNFNGQASFEYTVSDGALTDIGLVTFTITAVNDTPTDIVLSNATLAENAGVNASIGTLSGVDPETGDVLSFSLPAGVNNELFDISGTTLVARNSFDFEAGASYTVNVRVSDGSSTFDKQFTITITNVSEGVFASNAFYNKDASAERNTSLGLGATGQRSMIRNIEVVFDGDVANFPNGSFAVTKLQGSSSSTIGVTVVSSNIAAGKTTVVLGFTSGTLASGSLSDGNYRLVIDYGVLGIDGDGNGTIGGTRNVNFHRLFGDSDGDRDVDASDYKNYVAGVRGVTKWVSIFDSNNNNLLVSGSVQDNDDKIAFFANYGRGI